MIKSRDKIVFAASLIVGVVVAGVFWPQLVTRRTLRASRTQCMMNLKEIGMELAIYADASEGRVAAGNGLTVLNRLRLANHVDTKIFICPFDKIRKPAQSNVLLTEENCSYVFLDNLREFYGGSDSPICWDKPENHGTNGLNVLFADGHVSWMKLDAWEKIRPDK